MNIINELEKLRRSHYDCGDPWYSCPKHEDGCANDNSGDECDCGADDYNSVLDDIVLEVRKILKTVSKCDNWVERD